MVAASTSSLRSPSSSASLSPATASSPHRLVIFINVVGCGTRVPNGIRQNRCQEIESATPRHNNSEPSRSHKDAAGRVERVGIELLELQPRAEKHMRDGNAIRMARDLIASQRRCISVILPMVRQCGGRRPPTAPPPSSTGMTASICSPVGGRHP